MTNDLPGRLAARKQKLILFWVYKIICSFVWYDEGDKRAIKAFSLTRGESLPSANSGAPQSCTLLITWHPASCWSLDIKVSLFWSRIITHSKASLVINPVCWLVIRISQRRPDYILWFWSKTGRRARWYTLLHTDQVKLHVQNHN